MPSWWRRSFGSSTWSGRRCRRASWCRRSPTDHEVLEAWLVAPPRRIEGDDRRPGARGEAPADGGREPERRRGVPPAQAAARVRLRGAIARALGAGRAARPAAGAAADRVLRHLEPGADATRSARWWCSRTGCRSAADYRRFEIKGVPGQDDFASMEEMLRRRFARLLKERDEPHGRARDAGSPTRRRSSWWTAARASSASAARCWPTSVWTSRTSGSRSGWRRSTSRVVRIRC